MQQYVITKITGAPDWSTIPSLPISNRLWTPECAVSAEAQLCWSEKGIYVKMSAMENDIRAEHREPLALVCEDSCLEFFFSPIYGDQRYINIEFNPNCCVFFGMGYGRHDRLRMVPRTDPFGAKADRTKDGWNVTYYIPFELIRELFPNFAPDTGKIMMANFYKCGDLTVQPHYFSWNNIPLKDPDFHCSQYFGQLIFG